MNGNRRKNAFGHVQLLDSHEIDKTMNENRRKTRLVRHCVYVAGHCVDVTVPGFGRRASQSRLFFSFGVGTPPPPNPVDYPVDYVQLLNSEDIDKQMNGNRRKNAFGHVQLLNSHEIDKKK